MVARIYTATSLTAPVAVSDLYPKPLCHAGKRRICQSVVISTETIKSFPVHSFWPSPAGAVQDPWFPAKFFADAIGTAGFSI
jgi:hypothetical protein